MKTIAFGIHRCYTDANISDNINKVAQSPYEFVQKPELYGILMVLLNFPGTLNIVTNSQYVKRVVLHIKVTKIIPDDSQLTFLFI